MTDGIDWDALLAGIATTFVIGGLLPYAIIVVALFMNMQAGFALLTTFTPLLFILGPLALLIGGFVTAWVANSTELGDGALAGVFTGVLASLLLVVPSILAPAIPIAGVLQTSSNELITLIMALGLGLVLGGIGGIIGASVRKPRPTRMSGY